MASVLNALPPVLERHELKYLIPVSYVEPISDFIAPYCSLDHYSSLGENNFYLVNSLYLDTPNFEFLKQRMWGKMGRFNMRVRAYADGTKPPYFMEIKNKRGIAVKKYRATATAEQWPAILQDPEFELDPNESPKELANKRLFLRLIESYAVEPKILTQYWRRAFFSTVDNYARVTMDVNMRYRVEDRYTLVPGDDMSNYDNETIYASNTWSQGNVVLELKSNLGEVPIWMLDLIRHFDLVQTGFSKYMNATLVAHQDNGHYYLQNDRFNPLELEGLA